MRHGILSLLLVLGLLGCTIRDETVDKSMAEATIRDLAKSLTEFPKIRDKQVVLRFAAKDYAGIFNGERLDTKEMDQYLSGLLERINLGEPLGISYEVSNIEAKTSAGPTLTTYDFTYTLGSGGTQLERWEGKCTAVLKRENDAWLFQHEHCSSQTTLQQKALQDAIIRGFLKK